MSRTSPRPPQAATSCVKGESAGTEWNLQEEKMLFQRSRTTCHVWSISEAIDSEKMLSPSVLSNHRLPCVAPSRSCRQTSQPFVCDLGAALANSECASINVPKVHARRTLRYPPACDNHACRGCQGGLTPQIWPESVRDISLTRGPDSRDRGRAALNLNPRRPSQPRG